MFLSYLAFITTASTVFVQCHDCNDYDLSASDQSLVDMMKHYLHTSRKMECPPEGKQSTSGVTYIRWGKKVCPKGAEMVYTGQVGGNSHAYKAGGVNYLCLPNHPEKRKTFSGENDQLFGAEYETDSGYKSSGMKDNLQQKEVPCAVCHQRNRSVILMIPVKKTCHKGWTSEYSGYLLTDHKTHSSKEYACVDKDAEPLDNKTV